MKKLFVILALFLLLAACESKHEEQKQCFKVTFSDALPVQFWLNDCPTYNETTPQGVHSKCFCHPWSCDDELKVQFLNPFDSSEVIETENIVSITLPALSTWLTQSINPDFYDWTLGSNPTVNLPGTGPFEPDAATSEYLYTTYSFIAGRSYTITINYTRTVNSGSSNPRTSLLRIMDSGFTTLFSESESAIAGANSITITFTATSQTSIIGFRHQSGSDVDITLTSTSGTRTDIITTYPSPNDFDLVVYNVDNEEIERLNFDAQLNEEGLLYTHSASITPSDHGICDQKIKFTVINITNSPDEVVAKSDCVEVASYRSNPTLLIEYSNTRNFNGLVYEDVSPETVFQTRIPAIFFHERFPSDREVVELSNSQIINLNSALRKQKLLETDYIPYYMHQKIQLILMHDNVVIDGKNWTYNEAYELVEGDRRWPVKKGKVYLNQADFVQRNVI